MLSEHWGKIMLMFFPENKTSEGRQQIHQEETIQEEKQAGNLGRHQDFNSQSWKLGETTRTQYHWPQNDAAMFNDYATC